SSVRNSHARTGVRADRDGAARRHLRPLYVRGHPPQSAEVRRPRHHAQGVQGAHLATIAAAETFSLVTASGDSLSSLRAQAVAVSVFSVVQVCVSTTWTATREMKARRIPTPTRTYTTVNSFPAVVSGE